MKTVYISDDGKEFDTAELCTKHEKELKIKEENQRKYLEEKENRADEVMKAYDNYSKLKDEYEKDYGRPVFDWADFIFNHI